MEPLSSIPNFSVVPVLEAEKMLHPSTYTQNVFLSTVTKETKFNFIHQQHERVMNVSFHACFSLVKLCSFLIRHKKDRLSCCIDSGHEIKISFVFWT